MQAKDAINLALKSTHNLLNMYVADLSDQDLTVRPVPTANNIAWQLGHLISSEPQLFEPLLNIKYPPLPGGFNEAYSNKSAHITPPGGYLKKAEYLEMFNKVRSTTTAHVEGMADADFDKPTTGPMAKWAPTVGAMILLGANHVMMHAGQFSVVRRLLNKPILF